MVPEMKNSAHKTGSAAAWAELWTGRPGAWEQGKGDRVTRDTQRKEQEKQKRHPRAVDNVKGPGAQSSSPKAEREGGRRNI